MTVLDALTVDMGAIRRGQILDEPRAVDAGAELGMAGGGVVVVNGKGAVVAAPHGDAVGQRDICAGPTAGDDLQTSRYRGDLTTTSLAALTTSPRTHGSGFSIVRYPVTVDVGTNDVRDEQDEDPQHRQVGNA